MYRVIYIYIYTYLSVRQLPRASLAIGADILKYDYAVLQTYNQRSEAPSPEIPIPATPLSAPPSSTTPIISCAYDQRRLLTAAPSSTAPSSAKSSYPALLLPTLSYAILISDAPHPQSPLLATLSTSVHESACSDHMLQL